MQEFKAATYQLLFLLPTKSSFEISTVSVSEKISDGLNNDDDDEDNDDNDEDNDDNDDDKTTQLPSNRYSSLTKVRFQTLAVI